MTQYILEGLALCKTERGFTNNINAWRGGIGVPVTADCKHVILNFSKLADFG
jgi:hypothetical protein